MNLKKVIAEVAACLMMLSYITAPFQETCIDNRMSADVLAAEITESSNMLYKLTDGGEAKITRYTGNEENVVIPESIDGYKITDIEIGAFKNCDSIQTLTFSDTILDVDMGMFAGMNNLRKITFGKNTRNLTFYYDNDYQCFSKLAYFDVPEENPNYCTNNGILYNKDMTQIVKYPPAKRGTSFTIPDGVTNIGQNCFGLCFDLERVVIGSQVTTIGRCAFAECLKLKTIECDKSVQYFGDYIFYNSPNVTIYSENLAPIYQYAKSYVIKYNSIDAAPESDDLYSPVAIEHSEELEKEVEEKQERRLNIQGDMTVTPMTKEEVIEAGIDISSPDNYQCYNYSIEMNFEAEIVNFNKYEAVSPSGEVVDKVIEIVPPGKKKPVKIDPQVNKYTYVEEIGASVGYFETEEQEMYMIIYGSCKWLKEFYDVQLVVFNNDTETLKNCSVTLDVPNGLTLCNSEQIQNLGNLAPKGVFDVHWYLRGDKEGDYSLNALFTGEYADRDLEYEFHSKNTLHVYAGSAMNMTVELPAYSFYNSGYNVAIKLKNVSDKPIYDLEHKITNVKHGYYTIYRKYENGQVTTRTEHTLLSSGGGQSISVAQLDPGETAVIELTINDMFESILEKNIKNAKYAADVVNLFASTVGGGTPEGQLIGFGASYLSDILSSIPVAHVLKSVAVTTLEGSTTEIPYNVVITDLSEEERQKHEFHPLSILAKDAADTVLPDIVGPAYHDIKLLRDMPQTDEDQLPFEYAKNRCDQIEGVIDAMGDTDIPKISGASSIITVGEDIYFELKGPDDTISANVYVETVDGKKMNQSPQQVINRAYSMWSGNAFQNMAFDEASDISATDSFELGIEAGDYNYNDGKYNVNGNAVIKLKSNQADQKAIIHVEYSDGYSIDFPVVSVDKHECSGKYVFLMAPQNGKNGSAIKICSTCGKMLDCKNISSDYKCMLSNGQLFTTFEEALAAAGTQDETELSVFGDVNIEKSLTIPENVHLLIAPRINININDSSTLATAGTIDNFGNINGNCAVNIMLSYWEGCTQLKQVPFGTNVDKLTDISTDTCKLGGWYCDPEHTKQFEPFVAGKTQSDYIFYADINHDFDSKGICTKCGITKNGYDAFTKVYASVGGETFLNFIVQISDLAAFDSNAYITFEYPDGSVASQSIADAKNNNDGTYTFACKIPVNKMGDVIKAQMHYSNDINGSVVEYSYKKYMNAIIKNASKYDEKTVNCIKAMMNFGGYVQAYSNYNTDSLVNKELNTPLDNQNVVIGDEYKAVKSGTSNSIKATTANFEISSLAKINVFYELSDNVNIQNYKFTVDGKEITPVKRGEYYVVTVDKIAPENYDKMFKFTAQSVSDPDECITLEYSAFTYAKSILKGNYDSSVKNVMKALYAYNINIKNYMGGR